MLDLHFFSKHDQQQAMDTVARISEKCKIKENIYGYEIRRVCTQSSKEDCGPACVQSIYLCLGLVEPYARVVSRIFHSPCWTIDLFADMISNGVPCKFTTTYRGYNPEHSDVPFYQDAGNSKQEITRVNAQFCCCEKLGASIEIRSFSLDEIIDFLKKKGVLLCLINSNCINKSRSPKSNMFPQSQSPRSYHGHFIIVYAYQPDEDQFLYINPDDGGRYEMCSSKFDYCRKSQGTDQDTIWIEMPPNLSLSSI